LKVASRPHQRRKFLSDAALSRSTEGHRFESCQARSYVLPLGRPMEASAEPFGQSDDDALGAAEEAEPVGVLVLRDLADELGAVVAQAGD
jgi:hypothetical protein